MSGIFNGSIFNNAIFNTDQQVQSPPAPSTVGGGSGRRYRAPAWWGDEKKKKKKLEVLRAEVVEVQKKIEAKRHEIDVSTSIEKIERLIEQIAGLQKKLLELLARIDEVNKAAALLEDEEAIVAYIAHRMLH
jgi:hypothetical protein